MRRLIEKLAVCLVVGTITGGVFGAELIRWETDLKAAFDQAQASNRPLLLHFWTPECVPCKRLEQTVFNQSRVAGAVHALFIPVKIDANEYPELAAQYGVKSVPNDVIVTASDQELHRMFTPQDPDQYVAQLSAVAFRAGSTQNHQPSESGRGANPTDARYVDDRRAQYPRVQTSPDRSARSEYTADRTLGQSPDSSDDSGDRPSDQPPREVINRFARSSQETARPDEAGYSAYERETAAPGNGNVSGRTGPQTERLQAEPRSDIAERPDRRPTVSRERFVAQNAEMKAPQRHAAAESSSNASPPLGLDGFCPVSLLQKNSWTKGDAQFGVIHRGQVYLFAGPEEKETFFADPDEFSPVLAGIDPVRLAETGEAVMGLRAHGVVYRKRVYLFSSEEHLQQFWQEPERYASPIRQAMETGDVGRLFR